MLTIFEFQANLIFKGSYYVLVVVLDNLKFISLFKVRDDGMILYNKRYTVNFKMMRSPKLL